MQYFFVVSLSYRPCFSCCMPVSLHLSLSLCLSCVFLSVLDDACFGPLCHVPHHQEQPHLPLRSFHSPAPFFVRYCWRCILFWCPSQHLFFHANFQVFMLWAVYWPNAILFEDIFFISLFEFRTLERCVSICTLVQTLSFFHAITSLAPSPKVYLKRVQQYME